MALINQQGMYQGVSPLNPLPYVNIAMQARQRKAAREEAIDKYYQKLPDTINDKGVRDQEIPIINEGKNKIFEFGVRNREALRNPKVDNGAAQLTLDKMVRELTGVARLSQDAAKDDLEIGKIRLQKGNEWIVDDDEFLADNELHNLPVTDPRFKKIDINKVLQGRPFDEPSFAKDVRGRFKYTYGTPKVTDHPDDPLLQVETPTPILQQEEKNKIYAFAAETYHKSPKFRKTVSTALAGTGSLQKLNEISQQVFGKPIEDDEDIAAAYTVSKLSTPEIKPKVRANTGEVMDKRATMANAEWDRRTAQNQKNSLIKIAANRKAQGLDENASTSGNAFDEFGSVTPVYFESGGKIQDGIVFDKDGNLGNGEMAVVKSALPANVTVSLNTAKIPLTPYMNIIVKDGVIQAIKTKNGVVSRQAMENLQKKSNTEPIKAAQPVYGKPNSKAPTKVKPKNNPLGLNFDD